MVASVQNSLEKWHVRIGYGAGDYSLNLFWQGAGFYLFFFYTDILGISGASAGIIFMIGGIWDALSDPIVGYVAERTKSRWGSYRPYILFGSIPLALSFVLLFTKPDFDQQTSVVIYSLCMLLIFNTCYTIVSIPYSGLGMRLTRDSRERTRLSGVRIYCGFIGGLTAISIATYLQEKFSDEQAFFIMAIICALISVLGFLYCFIKTREGNDFSDAQQPAENFKEILSSLPLNKPLIILVTALVFVTIANTILGKTLLYYFEYNLNNRLAGNTAIMAMTISPLLAIPFWSTIILKYGKQRSWKVGGIFSVIGFILLYLDESHSVFLAIAEYTFINFGFMTYAVLLWSMLPDTIDYGEYHTKIRNESLIVGVISSFQKIALAAAAFLIGLVLDYIGYRAGEVQSVETLQNLKTFITIVPIVALLLSIFAISLYPLTAEKLIQMRAKK